MQNEEPYGDRLADDDLAAANATDAQLHRIIDTIPVLAWCNLPDGFNEFLNQRWQDYTGLSQRVASGWGWKAAFHPDDIGPLLERWRALLSSGGAGEIEARLRRHDGVYRWFLIRVEPLHDELGNIVRWYGTSTDIDDLKRAHAELERGQEELRRITDAIPQAILVLSPAGLPLYTNRVASDYTGVSLDEVGAENYRARVFHPEDLERLRAALSRPVASAASNGPSAEREKALIEEALRESEGGISGPTGTECTKRGHEMTKTQWHREKADAFLES